MNWQAGEGHIQRNTLEKAWWNTTTDYCKLLSDSFQNEEKRHGTMRWQSVEDKRKKKEKEKREEKKKKKREKWGKMTTIYSLSFPFSFLFLSLFSSFSWSSLPFSLSKRQERERERVRRKRGEEEGKKRKGKRVYCCHLPLLSFFLLFIFPYLLSFFPSLRFL